MGLAVSLILALCPQDGWREAASRFDREFEDAGRAARESMVGALGRFDRKEAVDRLIRAIQILEKELDDLLGEKGKLLKKARSLPELKGAVPGRMPDPSYIKNLRQWQQHWAKQADVGRKIQDRLAVRDAVVRALAGFRENSTVSHILSKMKSSAGDGQREALAEAASRIEHPDVDDALANRVRRDRAWRVRVVAIDGLAARRAVRHIDAVVQALGDDYWQVRLAAVYALEKFGDPRAIPALIDALKNADGRMKDEINQVLVRLTGVDKHGDHATWKRWWEENGDRFARGDYKPPENRNAGHPPRKTTFYGIPVVSKRVIFVIDKSGSMAEEAGWKGGGHIGTGGSNDGFRDQPDGTRKIDIAKFELRVVVRSLPEDTLFTIIAFSDDIQHWKQTLVPATRKNKEDALGWVNGLEPGGGTNTYGALEAAFAIQGPKRDRKRDQGADTIFFLTDGRPSVGEVKDPGRILQRVAEWNKVRKLKINTVAVGKEGLENTPQGGGVDPDFLKQLAEQNHGTHVWRK